MDLKALSERRLANLDAAIAYFQKRANRTVIQRAKVSGFISDDSTHSYTAAELRDKFVECNAEIRLLEDVISYLKLC